MKPIHPARLASALLLLPATILVLACSSVVGCVAKPGTALNVQEATPVTLNDPSSTHSAAVIGQETTTTHGPLITETSKLNDEGMWETNSGGAAKQRVSIVVLPDGTVRAGGSAASDLDIGEVESTWTPMQDGKANGLARTLRFKAVKTNNASVQTAVNAGVASLVAQWQRSSDNERAVLEAQLAAQAKIGDAVAATAQAVIAGLKTVSIP